MSAYAIPYKKFVHDTIRYGNDLPLLYWLDSFDSGITKNWLKFTSVFWMLIATIKYLDYFFLFYRLFYIHFRFIFFLFGVKNKALQVTDIYIRSLTHSLSQWLSLNLTLVFSIIKKEAKEKIGIYITAA